MGGQYVYLSNEKEVKLFKILAKLGKEKSKLLQEWIYADIERVYKELFPEA